MKPKRTPCSLRSRRGIGIEMAIFMLVVVFAACTLITTATLASSLSHTRHKRNFEKEITVNQIGEEFIGEKALSAPEGYFSQTTDGNNNIKTLIVRERNEHGKILLTVDADFSDPLNVKVIQWVNTCN